MATAKKTGVAAFFESFETADNKVNFKLASDNIGEKIPAITTGSYLLDDALSCLGWPKGRITQLYGPPSSGKSFMALLAIKNAQDEDPSSLQLFIDAEGTFSSDWAAKLGCDTSKIVVVDGDMACNGRQCFEMLLGVPKENAKHELDGKSKEGLLDKISKKDKGMNFNLIVLDSLGAIIPPGEDVSRIGKMNMALMARFLAPTFKKLSLEVSKADIPFLVINHKKDNMDPYGSDHTYSGGNSYSHHLSANVYFERVARKDSMILDENEQCIGFVVRASIEKSKYGPFPRKCEFKIITSRGIVERHEELFELGKRYNCISMPSSVMYVIGENKYRGQEAAKTALKEDVETINLLLQKIEEVREADRQTLLAKQKELTAERLGKVEYSSDDEESEEDTE